MSHNSGVISAPVSIDDVRAVLGETSTDLAALCKSSKINVWSKYKPIKCASMFSSMDGYGDIANAPYGVTLPDVSSSPSAAAKLYATTGNGYVTTGFLPTGGTTSPYRLGDFNKYNHYATAPCSDFMGTQNAYTSDRTYSYSAIVNDYSSSGDSISLADIGDFSNMYFGVAIIKGSYTNATSIYSMKTATATMGSGAGIDVTIEFTSLALSAGTYYAVPIISSEPYEENSSEVLGSYYPCPNLTPIPITVKGGSSITQAMGLEVNEESGLLDCIVTCAVQGTYRNVILQLRFASSDDYDAMVVGEYQKVLSSSWNAMVGNTLNYTFDDWDPTQSYKILLWANGNKVTEYGPIGEGGLID